MHPWDGGLCYPCVCACVDYADGVGLGCFDHLVLVMICSPFNYTVAAMDLHS